MTIRKASLLAALTLIVSSSAWGEDAKQIVTQTAEAYRNLQSYQFDGVTVANTRAGNSDTSSELKFTVAFESPDKFRIDYHYPTAGNWIRVSDGKTLTRYRSITKQVDTAAATPFDLRLIESTPIAAYSRLDQVADQAKLVGSEKINLNGREADCYVVEIPGEKPRFEGMVSSPTKLWIDKSTHLVQKEVSETTSGATGSKTDERRTTTYTNLQTSGDIPDTLFAFSK